MEKQKQIFDVSLLVQDILQSCYISCESKVPEDESENQSLLLSLQHPIENNENIWFQTIVLTIHLWKIPFNYIITWEKFHPTNEKIKLTFFFVFYCDENRSKSEIKINKIFEMIRFRMEYEISKDIFVNVGIRSNRYD